MIGDLEAILPQFPEATMYMNRRNFNNLARHISTVSISRPEEPDPNIKIRDIYDSVMMMHGVRLRVDLNLPNAFVHIMDDKIRSHHFIVYSGEVHSGDHTCCEQTYCLIEKIFAL